MNKTLVINTIGKLLMIESGALVLPLLVGLLYREHDAVWFILAMLLSLAVGFLLSKVPVKSKTIRVREGMAVVALGWIAFSLIGALPFCMGGYTSFTDGVFETISGFTTSGASILNNVEALSYCAKFWRSFTHWIGGMGILVFTVAVLPGLDVGAYQMMKSEATGPEVGKVMPRVKDTASTLYAIYIGFTLLEILLLMLGGMNLFEASVHTFGTVGTGGFGIKNDSMAGYSSFCQWVVTAFMLICSINFSLYFVAFKGRVKEIWRDEETRFFCGVVGVSTLLIVIDLTMHHVFGGGLMETLRHSAFQVGTVISTTGFATCDYDAWPVVSKAVLFCLYFFGACAGSTGGGPKSIRILVSLKAIRNSVQKLIHPRAVVPIKINGKALKEDTVNVIFGFLALYFIFAFLGTVVVSTSGLPIFDSLMAVAATLGNVGPGFGAVGPTCNYSQFNDGITWFLSFLMLAGRLELYTVLALFFPSFWRKN